MTTASATTRVRLLEAAGEIFASEGFDGATVRSICARADANVAAVHYHFGDKESLYREVVDYAFAQLHERFPRPALKRAQPCVHGRHQGSHGLDPRLMHAL